MVRDFNFLFRQFLLTFWLFIGAVNLTTTAITIPATTSLSGLKTNEISLVAVGGFIDVHQNMTADVDIVSISSNTHTTALPLPRPMAGFGSAQVNKTLYIVGGFYENGTVAYNFENANGNWTEVADFPYGIDGNAVAAVNDKLFAFGGEALHYGYMDYPWSYDTNTDQWQRSTKTAPEIGYNFAVSVNSSIYLITEAGNLYRTDDETLSWRKLSSMNTGRGGASCVVSSQKDAILVASGFYSYGTFPPVEVYNITTDRWRIVTQMLKPRGGAAAVLLPGDTDVVAVCGGYTDLPTRNIFADCELYDWRADQWNVASFGMNIARHGHALFVKQ